MDDNKKTIPWVEKYRPTSFENIVLDDINSKIFENIIKNETFPNLLLYGPPGTGKTTTIINLISAYQKKHNIDDKSLMIHLNASDDRGIDIIRSQINQFVNSKSLFSEGLKFVILDEADYMTKNAQQALHNMLEYMPHNVKICIICNYISKIEMSLQGEFIHIRFNKLPEKNIINFLYNIAKDEKLNDITKINLKSIQEYYKNDIRSMINFMQVNKRTRKSNLIIDDSILNEIIKTFKIEKSEKKICNKLDYYASKYKIEKQMILKHLLKYIIRVNNVYDRRMLNLLEFINHSEKNIKYFILKLINFFKL